MLAELTDEIREGRGRAGERVGLTGELTGWSLGALTDLIAFSLTLQRASGVVEERELFLLPRLLPQTTAALVRLAGEAEGGVQ